MFVQLQLTAQASGGQPSLSRGPTGPNQTPTGAVSSGDPLDFKSRTAPPSSHDRHAHSTQSPAPALHSQRSCHAHSTQSPAPALHSQRACHAHSTQSPTPALHSQRACHAHSTQRPAFSPPSVQVRAALVFPVKLFDSSFIVFIILNPKAKIVNFNRQQ